MLRKIQTGILLALFFNSSIAQHQELHIRPELWKKIESDSDTSTVLSAFRRGKVSGHFRYFFMATDNSKDLTDYYAHAIGGEIKFESALFKNFQFGVSGFFTFNAGSSDLGITDSLTGQKNRYEIGLFEIENPDNKNDIDRLEELYLKYHYKKSEITYGRQLLNTPFINLQDGRMHPTEVQGFWSEINELKNIKIEAGYIFGISPRSTVKWYKVDESIGIYPVGVDESGSKSEYAGNLESKGIILAGITFKPLKHLKLQLWNQYTQNIFNITFFQADYNYQLNDKNSLSAAVQVIRQDAIKEGGNSNPAKAYIQKGSKSLVFGARAGWKNNRWETDLNYTRISVHGKYLMPREWGRDPFFTFLPRERNEGFGDLNAYMMRLKYNIPAFRLSASAAVGKYDLPDINNYRLNKYGFPSYNQINLDIRYRFSKILKGLDAQLLYVYKINNSDVYNNSKYIFNKVNMSSWNLVFNYQF